MSVFSLFYPSSRDAHGRWGRPPPRKPAIPAKTDEPIEISFAVWTRGAKETKHYVGPGKALIPHWKGHCKAGANTYACPDLSALDILDRFRKGHQRCGLWLPALRQLVFPLLFTSASFTAKFIGYLINSMYSTIILVKQAKYGERYLIANTQSK